MRAGTPRAPARSSRNAFSPGRNVASLTMLPLLVDEVQQRRCARFQAARHNAERTRYFRERVPVLLVNDECAAAARRSWSMTHRTDSDLLRSRPDDRRPGCCRPP